MSCLGVDLAAREGFEVVASEDPAVFDRGLGGFDAIVLLNSTTDRGLAASEWFVGARRGALQRFVRGGGGVVAIHAAADSRYHWPWCARLIGARVAQHPPGTPAGALRRVDGSHPASRGLPERFRRADEWYYFEDFDPEARLLVTLEPRSIGAPDVNPNPVAWAREVDAGRVFYTAMGTRPRAMRSR